MASRALILPSAEREVEAIVDYLAGFGPQTARHFTTAYRRQLELLTSGVVDYGLSRMPELAELGYHACRVNTYVMLYCYEGDAVVVAHVFHQSQDYARLVLKDE